MDACGRGDPDAQRRGGVRLNARGQHRSTTTVPAEPSPIIFPQAPLHAPAIDHRPPAGGWRSAIR
eukprot:12213823-Alexandrium_andersonii.AAC.1